MPFAIADHQTVAAMLKAMTAEPGAVCYLRALRDLRASSDFAPFGIRRR